MAADYALLTANLHRFYDFGGGVVLVVGAGGGQLLDPACKPKKLIAIDRDRTALDQLEAKLNASGTRDLVEIVCASFEDVMLLETWCISSSVCTKRRTQQRR